MSSMRRAEARKVEREQHMRQAVRAATRMTANSSGACARGVPRTDVAQRLQDVKTQDRRHRLVTDG